MVLGTHRNFSSSVVSGTVSASLGLLLCLTPSVSSGEPSSSLHRRVAELSPDDTAYLRERGGPDVIDLLRRQVRTSDDPTKRVRALRLLREIDGLNHRLLGHALRDPSTDVVESALKVADGVTSQREFLRPQFFRLANHPEAKVRWALLPSLVKASGPGRLDPLAYLLRLDGDSPEVRAAIVEAVSGEESFPFLERLSKIEIDGPARGGSDVVSILVREGLAAEGGLEMARALQTRLQNRGAGVDPLMTIIRDAIEDPRVQPAGNASVADHFRGVLQDGERSPSERSRAIASLGLLTHDKALLREQLMPYLHAREPVGVQLGVLSVLGQQLENPVDDLLKNWRGYSPAVRVNCLRVATATDERSQALLRGIQRGLVSASEVPDFIGELLRNHVDPSLAETANRLLVPPEPDDHGLEDMEEFKPEPGMVGDSLRGRVYVAKECSMCHRVEGLGRDLGPSLVEALDRRGEEDFLYHFFDTGHEVAVEFVMYRVYLGRSQHLIGAITEETDDAITFNTGTLAKSETRIPREQIRRLSTSTLALMPDGDDFSNISRQAVADVLAYLNELSASAAEAFATTVPHED